MITLETVRAIVSREFPGATLRAVRDVSGGMKSTFVVSLPGERVVLAVRDPGREDAGFAVEPAVMGLVGRETGVPVPAVVARDLSGDALPPYYVTREVEGYDLSGRYTHLPRADREGLLVEAGRHLGELHREVGLDAHGRLCPDGDAIRVDPEGSWPRFLDSLMGRWIDELSAGRFSDLGSMFEAARGRIDEYAPRDPDPALLHFDFRPANLIANEGSIAAVLDWGLSVSGHAEYDLFKAEKNLLLAHASTGATRDDLGEYLYRGYEEEHELKPGWRERRAFYRIAYKLESMRSFDRWTADMTEEERDAMARTLREELVVDLADAPGDPSFSITHDHNQE